MERNQEDFPSVILFGLAALFFAMASLCIFLASVDAVGVTMLGDGLFALIGGMVFFGGGFFIIDVGRLRFAEN